MHRLAVAWLVLLASTAFPAPSFAAVKAGSTARGGQQETSTAFPVAVLAEAASTAALSARNRIKASSESTQTRIVPQALLTPQTHLGMDAATTAIASGMPLAPGGSGPARRAYLDQKFGRTGNLVPGIGSPCRVFVNRCEGPWKLLEDHLHESLDLFAKGSALPLSTVISHVQAPQMDGVAPYAKVFDGIVVGTGLHDDRSTVLAGT